MSILDGLPTLPDIDPETGETELLVYLDDVREALTNPTDEQVEYIDQVWRDYHYPIYDTITGQFRCACGEAPTDLHRIRIYLAAAAGGDDA